MLRFIARISGIVFGLFLYALGLLLGIEANIGYAPWEVFHVGLSKTTGLSIGTVIILSGLFIVVLVTVLGEKFGLGTILGVVLTGSFIDLIMYFDNRFAIIPKPGNLLTGALMLVAGLFIIAFGIFFYMGAAMGAGPRDNLMVVVARRTRFSVGICRGAVELTVTVVGWLLGGMVGLGTVISVVAIGFCVQITFKLLKFDPTVIKHERLDETFKALFGKKDSQ
ncbi:MAG: hypothetical protein FWG32_01115 [Oscillospiraceae bacterium]|nr:hypothetical protein [Oscillospiraceae bacterium]